jgi:hypothetical protein
VSEAQNTYNPKGETSGCCLVSLTGTSAGIGRCQLTFVGVGIGFQKAALRLGRRQLLKSPLVRSSFRSFQVAISVPLMPLMQKTLILANFTTFGPDCLVEPNGSDCPLAFSYQK